MRSFMAIVLVSVMVLSVPVAGQPDFWPALLAAEPGDKVEVVLVNGGRLTARAVSVRADALVLRDIDTRRRAISFEGELDSTAGGTVVQRSSIAAAFVGSVPMGYATAAGQPLNAEGLEAALKGLGLGRRVEVLLRDGRRLRARIETFGDGALTLSRGVPAKPVVVPYADVARVKPAGMHWTVKTAIWVGVAYGVGGLVMLLCYTSGTCVA